MWSISEVKKRGRLAFKANYWRCVLVAVIMGLFVGGTAGATSNELSPDELVNGASSLSPEQQAAIIAAALIGAALVFAVSLVIKIFLANPINIGCARFFQKNITNPNAEVGILKEGFQNYGRTFLTGFLRDLFIFLWSLLFIIPGIMKGYSYMLVPYILLDEPDLSPTEVLKRSEQLMKGNRWRAFLLDLSFLGWIIFGILTLGIGLVFWTNPYMDSTDAALYLELKNQQVRQ